jgi:EAL domain-containing protein (putative c-di-GMP-specific phosphodiesterase class I)
LPLAVHNETVFTTVSIGITLNTIGYEQPEECLRDADTAMYQAKANGRARYEIFSPDMHADAFSLWQLDADLRQAVERQEFEIHYQPIVSLANGQINGAEALLRWQHPQRGLLDAAEFMPLAEETGLIVPIGEWTIPQVCHQVKTWHKQGYSSLEAAINISARQFQHQNIPRLIESALQKTDLPIEALVIEITESVATKSVDTGLASLYELSAMGIKISIDDFGIGSALDCLKRFPLHHLKIDQSFVRDIINDPANAAITRAIIDMAHSLNLTVIAEGVETEEQLAFLRSYRCDFIQGYLLSHPLTVEAFTELLQQGWLGQTQLLCKTNLAKGKDWRDKAGWGIIAPSNFRQKKFLTILPRTWLTQLYGFDSNMLAAKQSVVEV